jgi:hypothetical protein
MSEKPKAKVKAVEPEIKPHEIPPCPKSCGCSACSEGNCCEHKKIKDGPFRTVPIWPI